jgi:hypothetical protein
MTQNEELEWLNRFDEFGEFYVRHHVNTNGFSLPIHQAAIKWLAQREAEAARLTESSQADMAAAASRAATAAERAASAAEAQARTARHALITAIAATVIAAIALIVSILGVLHLLG